LIAFVMQGEAVGFSKRAENSFERTTRADAKRKYLRIISRLEYIMDWTQTHNTKGFR
jgi:hypothetical protein